MYIGHNPLSDTGLKELVDMVQRNDSLTALDISNCKLNNSHGIEKLVESFKKNSKIRKFNIDNNQIEFSVYTSINAEADANALLVSLRTNPQSIDSTTLQTQVKIISSKMNALIFPSKP